MLIETIKNIFYVANLFHPSSFFNKSCKKNPLGHFKIKLFRCQKAFHLGGRYENLLFCMLEENKEKVIQSWNFQCFVISQDHYALLSLFTLINTIYTTIYSIEIKINKLNLETAWNSSINITANFNKKCLIPANLKFLLDIKKTTSIVL